MASRRWPFVALAVGVLAAGAAVGSLALGGDDDDDTSTETTTTTTTTVPALERVGSGELDDTMDIEIGEEPSGYRITYRVSLSGVVTTEELRVARPFTSETIVRSEAGELVGDNRSAFGRLFTDANADQPLVLAVGPALPIVDLRFAPVLEDALANDLLVPREQREVAGRRCQVYRAGTTVSDGRLVEPEGTDEYADVCVDGRGLVLEEWWVDDGNPVRHRVATEVVETPVAGLGDGWSEIPTSMGIEQGGGSIQRLRDGSSAPGERFDLGADDAPDDFEHLGRFSVIPPQAEAFSAEGDRSQIRASVADVWRRGIDVLILDQGGTLGGAKPFDLDPANPTVEIPGIGSAELIVGLGGSEVRALRPGGHFVRIAGTLPATELVEVMRALVATSGTEIVVDDSGPLLRES